MKRLIVAGVLIVISAPFVWRASEIWSLEPPTVPKTLRSVPSIYPVHANGVVGYIISNATSPVVLINPGNEPSAKSIVHELHRIGRNPEEVHAILLTHGSYDHWRGHDRFPNARTYASQSDLQLVDHARNTRAIKPKIKMRIFGRPSRPKHLNTLVPAERLKIGKLEFNCVPVPGVTIGSMAFHFEDTLFVGDTVWHDGSKFGPPPYAWVEHLDALNVSFERIKNHPTTWIATSRHGLVARTTMDL